MNIGDRITLARERKGLTKAAVARYLGIKPPSVAEWESGETRPDMKRLNDLAKLLEVTVGWLTGEEGQQDQKPEQGNINLEGAPFVPQTGPQFVPGAKDFPVLGNAEAGDGIFIMDIGEPIDFVVRPIGLANRKDAYGLYVQGDSMNPVFESGDLVFVDPRRPYRAGRDHVIQLKARTEGDTMRFMIKRLVKRAGKKWVFKQFNPDKEIELGDQEIAAVHLILKNHEMMRS